jgi:hypothetical protein
VNKPHLDARQESDAVPLFGRWRNAYFAIVGAFVLEVAFFYFVSRYFS